MENNVTDTTATTTTTAATTSATTIPQLVQSAAEQFGDNIFLEQDNKRLSFQNFSVQTRQVAAALIAHGIQAGDRVAVWAPNSCEWVIAALGVHCAGGILVTLNTRFKGEEAAYILRQSGTKLLVTIGHFLDTDYPAMLADKKLPDLQHVVVLGQASTPQLTWDNFLSEGNGVSSSAIDQRMSQVSSEDISDLLFTSGTTGKPKAVMTAHGQNLRTFSSWSANIGIDDSDRYLVVNPFFHSFGYKAGILVCLIRGATLLPHAIFDPAVILQRISADRITVLPGPPTLFQSILAHPELDNYDISSLKKTATGAASIPVELIQQMKQRLGFERIITAYGLTESCGVVSMCRPNDSAVTIATTSGRALADTEMRCVDGDNKQVPPGETGEIVVRGYNVMRGYFDNDAATAEAIDSDDWLHTGDIGVIDQHGNLRITDRLKDVFITGGFNCYPAEIENALAQHTDIAMSAVIGVADKLMGEVSAAFVVLKQHATLNEDQLIAWSREHMANYKVPRHVFFIEALPLNASGKVVKPELRQRAQQLLH